MSARLPLYDDEHNENNMAPWGGNSNAGLYWSKFLKSYVGTRSSRDNPWKTQAVLSAADRLVGTSGGLKEANTRLSDLIATRGGHELLLRSRSSFVTGLGIEHPLENGFTWHATLGAPYLPGSSLKGLVRSWAATWQEGLRQEDIDRIFGPIAADPEKSVGSVVFLDALPTSPPALHADIINPHYGEYYSAKNPKTPPADWLSPVPVPLLTVGRGLGLRCGILPRRPGNAHDRQDAEAASIWLREAFDRLGAGAKTAKGYGRFEVDADELKRAERMNLERQAAQEERDELARLSSGRSEVYVEFLKADRQHGFEANKDYFMREGLEHWIQRLEQAPDTDLCQALEDLVRVHFKAGILDRPDDQSFKPGQRALVKRLFAAKATLGR